MASALGALGGRLDSKFLTAYWVPAFVALLCGLGILSIQVGPERVAAWIYDLDSVEQTLATVIVALAVTMVASILRALSRPIALAFAGDTLPSTVAAWSTRGQKKTRYRTMHRHRGQGSDREGVGDAASPEAVRKQLTRVFPLEADDTRPTLLGNILETAAEYPRITYTMEGLLWWPRLAPLVASSFHDMLSEAQVPMMALLNLSIVFAGVAVVGAPVLILGGHLLAAIVTVVVSLILARLCYQAASGEATEVANLLKVGFDLYRHEILRQMDIEIPHDLADERALWNQLSSQMLGLQISSQNDQDGESRTGDDDRPAPA